MRLSIMFFLSYPIRVEYKINQNDFLPNQTQYAIKNKEVLILPLRGDFSIRQT